MIGLDFAQRYKLGVGWNTYGTLYLQQDRWNIATVMKKGNVERQVMTIHETKLVDQQDMGEKTHVVTTHTVTFHPIISQ